MPIQSHPIQLGTPCPDFSLPSVDGNHFSRDDFAQSKALLVAFICSHCPYVKAIEERLLVLAQSFSPSELQVVGICSNDASEYPEDSPEQLLIHWRDKNFDFPYLIDESQAVARAFKAACTPDLYLYDAGRKLYYHGRLDDNWKEPLLVTREELAEAVEGILQGEPAPQDQMNAIGCSIKWKS